MVYIDMTLITNRYISMAVGNVYDCSPRGLQFSFSACYLLPLGCNILNGSRRKKRDFAISTETSVMALLCMMLNCALEIRSSIVANVAQTMFKSFTFERLNGLLQSVDYNDLSVDFSIPVTYRSIYV